MFKRELSVLFVVSALIVGSQAQKPPDQAKPELPAWLQAALSSRLVYSVPGMDRVKVDRDISYKQIDATQLKMDVYRPPDLSETNLRPAVIFVHGGYLPADVPVKALPKEWGV
ncbi:MAG TPA: hypothetical protein VJA94_00585, partial [Candidatus Angelobacter sp.]